MLNQEANQHCDQNVKQVVKLSQIPFFECMSACTDETSILRRHFVVSCLRTTFSDISLKNFVYHSIEGSDRFH